MATSSGNIDRPKFLSFTLVGLSLCARVAAFLRCRWLGGRTLREPHARMATIYRAFRLLLRQKREDAGPTQVDLARRIRETQSYVSICERGERRLDLVQLRVFCRAIGISLTDFVREFDQRTTRARR
jgi:ribosome-binding protein aMBF1 (putative translation factor)